MNSLQVSVTASHSKSQDVTEPVEKSTTSSGVVICCVLDIFVCDIFEICWTHSCLEANSDQIFVKNSDQILVIVLLMDHHLSHSSGQKPHLFESP
jgi:hypothetical protein